MDLSKDDLRPFDPRDPLYRRKLWVRVVTPESVWYHVFWGRIVAVCVALCLAGWLAAATAAWAFVRYHRGYEDVRFLDLAFYPLRAEQYRAGLGKHYVAQGNAEIAKGNYREGYGLLLAGLARNPDDLATRRLVATTELRLGLADRALATLTAGAERASGDLDYMKLLFGLLLELQRDDRAIELAKQLLPAKADGALPHLFIALEAATAHFQRGRYDETERIVTAWQLAKSLEGSILLAQCDWERGFPQLALLRLEGELPRYPQRDELYLQLIRFHRELGHLDEARRYALLRQLRDPASPGPRIDLLRSYHASHDNAAEARELATYLADFKTNPQALALLAWFAVDAARAALAEQIHTLAVAQKFPLETFNLARVQAAFAAQDYTGSLAWCDAALREEPAANKNFSATISGLQALDHFALHDTAPAVLQLTKYLDEAHPRAADALLIARQLRLLSVSDQARRVLERACLNDPMNEAALAELVRLDAEAGDRAKLTENLPRLLRLRKPSRAALEETLLHLDQPGDASLRDQIRSALARASATPAP